MPPLDDPQSYWPSAGVRMSLATKIQDPPAASLVIEEIIWRMRHHRLPVFSNSGLPPVDYCLPRLIADIARANPADLPVERASLLTLGELLDYDAQLDNGERYRVRGWLVGYVAMAAEDLMRFHTMPVWERRAPSKQEAATMVRWKQHAELQVLAPEIADAVLKDAALCASTLRQLMLYSRRDGWLCDAQFPFSTPRSDDDAAIRGHSQLVTGLGALTLRQADNPSFSNPVRCTDWHVGLRNTQGDLLAVLGGIRFGSSEGAGQLDRRSILSSADTFSPFYFEFVSRIPTTAWERIVRAESMLCVLTHDHHEDCPERLHARFLEHALRLAMSGEGRTSVVVMSSRPPEFGGITHASIEHMPDLGREYLARRMEYGAQIAHAFEKVRPDEPSNLLLLW